MLSRFLGDRGGNFGVMTAILMVPLIGATAWRLSRQDRRVSSLRERLKKTREDVVSVVARDRS